MKQAAAQNSIRTTLKGCATVAALMLCSSIAVAQVTEKAGSSLLDVAKYLQRAQEELHCSTSEASRWTSVAATTLRTYQPTDQADRDTVDMLRVRLTFLNNDIAVRQKAIKEALSDT